MASTHVLNGNEVAIDRATPKDKGSTMLPGRQPTMGNPNMPLGVGGSGHGFAQYSGFTRQSSGQLSTSPPRYGSLEGSGMLASMGGRRASHQGLANSAGSPPAGGLLGGSMGGSAFATQAAASNQQQHMFGGGSGSSGFGPQQQQYGGGGVSLTLLAQAQAAALQHHLSNGNLAGLEGTSPSHLISLLSANATAGGGGGGGGSGGFSGLGHSLSAAALRSNSMGHLPQSAASSDGDLAGLMASAGHHQAQEQLAAAAAAAAAGNWSAAAVAAAAANGLAGASMRASTSGGMTGPMGPASARAGPRIFVGKLNKETSEQDLKDYFIRYGYVMDVYLPRGEWERETTASSTAFMLQPSCWYPFLAPTF
jgi:RNA-binding protein Musashi